MNQNFVGYYKIQKDKNSNNNNNNEVYNNYIKISTTKKKVDIEEDITNVMKNTRKISDDNSNKNQNQNQNAYQNIRYFTPLQSRYQTQSYDKVKNSINNNNILGEYAKQNKDINSNVNQYQYQYSTEKTQREKDNDALYYKNLYLQTKNNLNKEKQKNEPKFCRLL